jgi:hypothetical protein
MTAVSGTVAGVNRVLTVGGHAVVFQLAGRTELVSYASADVLVEG